jgi:hypothetical protein
MGVSILRQRYKIYWKGRIPPDWGFAFLLNEMIGSVILKLLIMNQLQRDCLINKLCGGDIHIEVGVIQADLNIGEGVWQLSPADLFADGELSLTYRVVEKD